MLLGASLLPPALAVDDTLWPAVGRSSYVAAGAGAHWSFTQLLADCMRATWGGQTGVRWSYRWLHWDWDLLTVTERVSIIVGRTGADGMVPHHMAPGVDATPARAGVLALLVETGLILSAV